MTNNKKEMSYVRYKVCDECGDKSAVRYCYKRKDKLILYKKEHLAPFHYTCKDLAELREEFELLQACFEAKRQQITDKEWEIFSNKKEQHPNDKDTDDDSN